MSAEDANVSSALKELEKEFGAGIITTLGSQVGKPAPSIPTGLYSVDWVVFGCGGFPKGRIAEVYGPLGSGKTSLALRAVSQAQRLGQRAAYIDVENALEPNWMKTLGVDVDSLLVSQPSSGEQAISITDKLLATNAFSIIVIDSVAALVPQKELDGDIEDNNVGLQARLMAKACRKLNKVVSNSGAVLIFINQLREKIGVMYGSPETTPGGKSLGFYSSLRVDVRKRKTVEEGGMPVGHEIDIKAVKNRMGVPGLTASVNLYYDRGFDGVDDLIDYLVPGKVVEKAGAWYKFGDQKFQGKAPLAAYIRENGLYESLVKKLQESK